MPIAEDRHQRRHGNELALARQLADICELAAPSEGCPFKIATFRHSAQFGGVMFAAADHSSTEGLRIRIAEASGLGFVGGVLAAQTSLELLRRAGGSDLVELNRYFCKNPLGENALLAAATLRMQTDGLAWTGCFAGMSAPILVDESGLVEVLMGSGPFLGLAETTFPIVRGLLHPGTRLFLLAGSGAKNLFPAVCDCIPKMRDLPLSGLVGKLGSELVPLLEPELGLFLLGVESEAGK